MRSLFLSPHCDDESLFGAFTILKYRPHVVICFPSWGDYGSTEERFRESQAACGEFGLSVSQLNINLGLDEALRAQDVLSRYDIVWAPSTNASHPDHRDLAEAAARVFGPLVRRYETYQLDEHGTPFKVRTQDLAPIDDRRWIQLKLAALARYGSQIAHPRASQFFTMDLHEYAEQP